VKKIMSTLIACAVLFLCACSSAPVQKGTDEVVVMDVPFFPQEEYQCGPASLAGVLRYWGSAVTVKEIAGDIFSRSARGTLTIDMLLYAERQGYTASQYAGSPEDLKAKVRAGYPLIVLVDYGFFVYRVDHFMVVIGYDDKGVVVNSGKSESKYVAMEDFLKSWKRTNNWTLWIKPKVTRQ
jgi:predicted double-glycine peptidase